MRLCERGRVRMGEKSGVWSAVMVEVKDVGTLGE